MGCVQSSETSKDNTVNLLAPTDTTGASHTHQRIYNDQRQNIKILLLGARESGKSTILKQMKLLYGIDFTLEERDAYKEVILANILDSMKAVLNALPGLDLEITGKNQTYATVVLGTRSYPMALTPKVGEAICILSKDPIMKQALLCSNKFQLHDNASYYFESADRICSARYLPTNQDILQSNVTTTGISKTSFTFERFILDVFDLGGSRSERRKWSNCFDNCNVIIFLASLSEYNQNLIEEPNQDESFMLFSSIAQSRWFINTSMILFLNKFDLFVENLSRSPLEKQFSEYRGGQNYGAACDYIQDTFTACKKPDQTLYTHIICATDTASVRSALNSMEEIIRNKYIQESHTL